jgi:putative membrane-bound dehydrogenase-like protein
MRYLRFVLLILCIAASDRGGAQDAPVEFLNPEQAIAKMTVQEGFNVRAFAAEPDIVQPFAFTFDDRGRVWALENLNYETRGSDKYDAGPQGRIIILEDTDGDGQADKKTQFGDKFLFPTGIALGFGGVWIGSPPNLLFIPDRDGDDQPDGPPEVVLEGWARNDRHETLNTFLWGPDGWLYGCHGVFTHSLVGVPGTPESDREPINAGVWRYHPTQKKFEVFAWGTSNPWGLDFDNHGQMFVTACVIPHLWHMIQGGRYHRQAGSHFNPYTYDDIKTVANHRHKSAHGGARFYLADSFPEKYHQRLFMCNIHEHAVLTDRLKRKGSGFEGEHGDDFVLCNDEQWVGFNMEIGPEGAVYVLDWHDADICGNRILHGETGRIWRIAHEATTAPAPFNLAKLSDAELVDMHLHANDWYVRQARRLLQERAVAGTLAAGTHDSLRQLLAHAQTPRRLRGLWTLHCTGGADIDLLTSLLDHDDEYLRAWSIQLLAESQDVSPQVLAKWSTMAADDPSPLVRLYLASAMQRVPVDARWPVISALAQHDEDHDDHNLPLMVWYALEPAVPTDLPKALAIAKTAKLPKLATYIAMRIAGGSKSNAKLAAPSSTPLAKKPAAAKSVSSDGLVLWFKSDAVATDADNTVEHWNDTLRNGRQATPSDIAARPKRVDDLAGRAALIFDGKDDHLAVPHDQELAYGPADSFSVSAWVHLDAATSGWKGLVTKGRDQSPWYGMWIDPNGKWAFGGGSNIAGKTARAGWQHVCIVQSGGQDRCLYVDGDLTGRGPVAAGNGKGDLWIGGAKSTNEFFRGGISEVRVYQRALSHAEVVHLAEQD